MYWVAENISKLLSIFLVVIMVVAVIRKCHYFQKMQTEAFEGVCMSWYLQFTCTIVRQNAHPYTQQMAKC